MKRSKMCLYPLFLAVFFSVPSLFSFVYEMKVLRKWDPQLKHYRYVIGCCDFHDRADASNQAQRKALEAVLSSCNYTETMVIVEDLATGSNMKKALKGRFLITSNGGVLGGLTGMCVHLGVPVRNVEYRHSRVAALGPLIHSQCADVGQFNATRCIKMSDLVQEIRAHMKSFNASMNSVLTSANFKHMVAAGDESVADYLTRRVTDHNRFTVLKGLLTFDSQLLDVAMLQTIASTHKKYVLLIAGGSHVDRVTDRLQRQGYRLVHASTPFFTREYQPGGCLGQEVAHGGKSYCAKPRPLLSRQFKRSLIKLLYR